jgi:hypothetical protein
VVDDVQASPTCALISLMDIFFKAYWTSSSPT